MSTVEFHTPSALTLYQRPIGRTNSYVVACSCGWESKMTTDYRKAHADHVYRVQRVKARTAGVSS